MKLSIYSLRNILFQGEAVSFNCPTAIGEITVLDHHRPLISVLQKGLIKIKDGFQQERSFPITSGFLEIKSTNEARLLVEE